MQVNLKQIRQAPISSIEVYSKDLAMHSSRSIAFSQKVALHHQRVSLGCSSHICLPGIIFRCIVRNFHAVQNFIER